MSEDLARTVIAIARQYVDRCCSEPLADHLAIELAAICNDESLSDNARRDARAILEEAACGHAR